MRQQCWFWSLLYLVFALSIGICGFIARKQWMVGCSAQGIAGAACPPACHSPVETTHLQKDASNETSGIDPVLWLVCGTIRLMATTNQMTQDIVPVPFLWILPLGLYLLTFIIKRRGGFISKRKIAELLIEPLLAGIVVARFTDGSYSANTA